MQIVLLTYLALSAIATFVVIAASIVSSRMSRRQEANGRKRKYARPVLRTIRFPRWWSQFECRTAAGRYQNGEALHRCTGSAREVNTSIPAYMPHIVLHR